MATSTLSLSSFWDLPWLDYETDSIELTKQLYGIDHPYLFVHQILQRQLTLQELCNGMCVRARRWDDVWFREWNPYRSDLLYWLELSQNRAHPSCLREKLVKNDKALHLNLPSQGYQWRHSKASIDTQRTKTEIRQIDQDLQSKIQKTTWNRIKKIFIAKRY